MPEANINAYLRTKVMTAKPEQVRLMLLDGAIKFARQGRAGMAEKNYEQVYEGVSQCRDIVSELLTSIAPGTDPVLAERVRTVYGFLFRELMEVSFSRDLKAMDRVIELLEYERETWVLAMEKLAKERAEGLIEDRPLRPTGTDPAPTGDAQRRSVSIEA